SSGREARCGRGDEVASPRPAVLLDSVRLPFLGSVAWRARPRPSGGTTMSRSIARSPARHQKAPARGPQRWAATIVLVLTSATVAAGAVPTPTVSGPITSPGSAFLTPPSTLDWSSYGYVEEEFFVAGTATAYTAAAALSSDGLWTA